MLHHFQALTLVVSAVRLFMHGPISACFNPTLSAPEKILDLPLSENKQEFVRPRWPNDMRPSVRAEKYIRDAGP